MGSEKCLPRKGIMEKTGPQIFYYKKRGKIQMSNE
jgi:hypothetical protein